MYSTARRYRGLGIGRLALLGAVLALVGWLAGCSGNLYTEPDGGYDGSPSYHYFTLVLNVSDPDGYPLPGCSVWIDGELATYQTGNTLYSLTDGPSAWYGYRYNWRENDILVTIPWAYSSSTVNVEVTKSGWRGASTNFTIYEWDDVYLWGRATFVMQPLLPLSVEGAQPESQSFPSEKIAAPSQDAAEHPQPPAPCTPQ